MTHAEQHQAQLKRFAEVLRTIEESLSEVRGQYAELHAALTVIELSTSSEYSPDKPPTAVPVVILTQADVLQSVMQDTDINIDVEGRTLVRLGWSKPLAARLKTAFNA